MKPIGTPDDEKADIERFKALTNAWVNAHGEPMPWHRAVRMFSIFFELNSAEESRLLDLNMSHSKGKSS